METNINTIRELINHLIARDEMISTREQVIYVLVGLDLEYTSLITNITNKKHLRSLDEVLSRMRTYEQQLQRIGNMHDPLLIQGNLAKFSINMFYFSSLPNFVSNVSFPFNIGAITTNIITNTPFSNVNFPNIANTNNVVNTPFSNFNFPSTNTNTWFPANLNFY